MEVILTVPLEKGWSEAAREAANAARAKGVQKAQHLATTAKHHADTMRRVFGDRHHLTQQAAQRAQDLAHAAHHTFLSMMSDTSASLHPEAINRDAVLATLHADKLGLTDPMTLGELPASRIAGMVARHLF